MHRLALYDGLTHTVEMTFVVRLQSFGCAGGGALSAALVAWANECESIPNSCLSSSLNHSQTRFSS